jgi:hypothetical protein
MRALAAVRRAEARIVCCAVAGEVDLKAKQEEKRLRKLASLNAREEARKATHAATKAAQARTRHTLATTLPPADAPAPPQVKATLAPALGRISKKKAKGFRIKKNGARPAAARSHATLHALTLAPLATPRRMRSRLPFCASCLSHRERNQDCGRREQERGAAEAEGGASAVADGN